MSLREALASSTSYIVGDGVAAVASSVIDRACGQKVSRGAEPDDDRARTRIAPHERFYFERPAGIELAIDPEHQVEVRRGGPFLCVTWVRTGCRR